MKTVLITGSSSGFGLDMVRDFLNSDYRVIATLRNASERKELFQEFLPNDNLVIKNLDVTVREDQRKIAEYIEAELAGELDLLINNAGYGVYGALEDVTENQIRDQFEVNFFGATFLIQELLPFLRRRKGKIINISSVMGRFSMPLGSIYSASKYAIEGLTEGLYYELKAQGVQITSIEPGGHRTGFVKAVVWGEKSHHENSLYKNETRGLVGLMERLSLRKNAPSSRNISQLALKLAKKNQLPRRVLIGNDARATGLMQKILPESWYHFFMSKGFKSLLKGA
ncbi:MAG: SDR family oxidoreductase [Halobacteriovoraceae bacterium]|jgi:NAD(P)-dependent dehydrogenase (short-subunit alcohol dehydrogenase family)|nr:SDR family oxidoreductase [Halobacteriovoraceae bacterium]MBT5092958.1 SDR family oxidoreductase [Halobacteriovoraceae bacterium]